MTAEERTIPERLPEGTHARVLTGDVEGVVVRAAEIDRASADV